MNQKKEKIMINVVGVGIHDDPNLKEKHQKGITLIALVITIIVLLILAGVTINMVLGDDGIIQQAQSAKEANEKGNEKDAISIAKGEAATAKYAKQEALSFEEAQKTFTTLTEENYNKSVAKVVDGVPIPLGFAYVEGTKKDTGLIVVDGYGNEFVWVPVSNPNTFTTLTKGWDQGAEQTWRGTEPTVLTSTSYDGNETNKAAILDTDKYSDLSTQFTSEYNAMVGSVKIYGGFYVGRYETSWTGNKVASVGNVISMTAATLLEEIWSTSVSSNANKATWYGLYVKQKELYNKESDSVVSGMIYGCQYDAIMNWMSDIENPNAEIEDKKFIKDSTGMGWYYDNNTNNSTHLTGLNLNGGMNKVNNIYDLAGNYTEWTQEAYGGCRVFRGGSCSNAYSNYPASYRSYYSPAEAPIYYSSRLQLYIK